MQTRGDAQLAADKELASARSGYDGLPDPVAASSLAAHLNVPQWAWDLIMAGLRSIATMGASVALGAALHGRRTNAAAKVRQPIEVEVVAPRPIAQPRRSQTKPMIALPAPRDGSLEHDSQFLKHTVFRPDPRGEASLKELQRRYVGWCQLREVPVLPPAEFGKQLRSIIDAIGLECEPKQGDMIIHGATVH
jgi:hypothetical protein